ncbi:S-adenosyl methyltransferase [Herbihabitans rhizosphaerae]|uniref:S-adenosyl methyltransferase n=1 Tax=Herbihabitans rhizosphaerae TaxID=1872711 RepID=A0A4Q7KDR3_9PSEU|nr:S-adenosyl methyltransferase [Herbihabitans rhizosphaerae]
MERPSAARIYDYLLGGTANWAIDRKFGDAVVSKFPLARDLARANRQFLNRAVRYLTKQGVKQFLDIGAGVPTAGNTHQVADELLRGAGQEPDVRVVYVDNEPVAVAHADLLLNEEGDATRHAVIEADLRRPDDLWQEVLDTEIFDLDEPIALLLIAVLHFQQPDTDGNDVGEESVARLRELLPTGSYLALSHATDDGVPDEHRVKLAELKAMYAESASSSLIFRPRTAVASLLGDFQLVEPGWTWTPDWRPEETGPQAQRIRFPTPAHAVVWAGVGQKLP